MLARILAAEYKGKWFAPLIDNPEYKGQWKPRKIPCVARPSSFALARPQRV